MPVYLRGYQTNHNNNNILQLSRDIDYSPINDDKMMENLKKDSNVFLYCHFYGCFFPDGLNGLFFIALALSLDFSYSEKL